jgi:hypothetical protein
LVTAGRATGAAFDPHGAREGQTDGKVRSSMHLPRERDRDERSAEFERTDVRPVAAACISGKGVIDGARKTGTALIAG